MATLLDTLADLVADPVARSEYRHDPTGWLAAHDSAELCGEDVARAETTLRRWFGDELPGAGGAERDLQPGPGESELDAAVRRIDHLLAALPDPTA